jgi:hypothetical protein
MLSLKGELTSRNGYKLMYNVFNFGRKTTVDLNSNVTMKLRASVKTIVNTDLYYGIISTGF